MNRHRDLTLYMRLYCKLNVGVSDDSMVKDEGRVAPKCNMTSDERKW